MILVYSNKITARLRYVCNFIFTEYYNVPYKLIDIIPEVISGNVVLLNYSKQLIDKSYLIFPSGLLTEKGINTINLKKEQRKEMPYIFCDDKSIGKYDIFSAVFYLISRYEEYLPNNKDLHGRFKATESFAYKNNCLQIPIIDYYLIEFELQLKSINSEITFKKHVFQLESTIDIDNAFAYKGKKLKRIVYATIKSLLLLKFNDIKNRIQFLFGKINDPYNEYDFQIELYRKTKTPLTYFILNSENNKYDRSLPPDSSEFNKLIIKLAHEAEIAIHPSYSSNSNVEKVKKEIEDLSKKCGKKIRKSRQHFLKIILPQTPLNLISCGIKEDYSMGYSTHNGFRAGTCHPFYFYDLTNEETKDLLIKPFALMDSVFYDHQKIEANMAFKEIKSICDEVRKVNGNLISIWHDRSFNEQEFPGWKNNYVKLHEYCIT